VLVAAVVFFDGGTTSVCAIHPSWVNYASGCPKSGRRARVVGINVDQIIALTFFDWWSIGAGWASSRFNITIRLSSQWASPAGLQAFTAAVLGNWPYHQA